MAILAIFFSIKWTQGVHKVIRAMSERSHFFFRRTSPSVTRDCLAVPLDIAVAPWLPEGELKKRGHVLPRGQRYAPLFKSLSGQWSLIGAKVPK